MRLSANRRGCVIFCAACKSPTGRSRGLRPLSGAVSTCHSWAPRARSSLCRSCSETVWLFPLHCCLLVKHGSRGGCGRQADCRGCRGLQASVLVSTG
jgi:hypothetical protein